MEVAEYTDLLIQVITEATKDGSVTRSKNPDGWLRLRIDGLTTFQRNGRTIYDNTPMTVLWNQEKGSFVVMGPLWRNYLLTGPVAKRLLKHICKEAKYQMPWMNIEVEMRSVARGELARKENRTAASSALALVSAHCLVLNSAY